METNQSPEYKFSGTHEFPVTQETLNDMCSAPFTITVQERIQSEDEMEEKDGKDKSKSKDQSKNKKDKSKDKSTKADANVENAVTDDRGTSQATLKGVPLGSADIDCLPFLKVRCW